MVSQPAKLAMLAGRASARASRSFPADGDQTDLGLCMTLTDTIFAASVNLVNNGGFARATDVRAGSAIRRISDESLPNARRQLSFPSYVGEFSPRNTARRLSA
jgi:hypothetical protein